MHVLAIALGNVVSGTRFICTSPFQNPGFDFSGADLSGNYTGGGPQFDS